MKVAAPPQIYILQRSYHESPEPINLNHEPKPTINNNLSIK